VNGATTNYTLDIAAGLTQVLSDSTRLYLYGPSTGSGHAGRIAQHSVTGTDYFLGDALGSVRQLADGRGEVTLARSYAPYGEVMSSSGEGTTSYDFAGETRDYTGLIYLRARYISTAQGRFLSRDTWPPDHRQPMSLNAWLYAYANPVMYTDPTGNVTRDYCESISDPTARQACIQYGVTVEPSLPNACSVLMTATYQSSPNKEAHAALMANCTKCQSTLQPDSHWR